MGKIGRPRIVETPEEFEEGLTAYLAQCEEEERPPTLSGLALSLGFADRVSLWDYRNRPEFSTHVKKAWALISQHHEARLSANNPAGSIFWLKNTGWSDRQDIDVTSGGEKLPTAITVKLVAPDADNGD